MAGSAVRGVYDDLSQLSPAVMLGRRPKGLLGTSVCTVSNPQQSDEHRRIRVRPPPPPRRATSSAPPTFVR